MLTRESRPVEAASPTKALAEYVAGARYEELPADVVAAARRYILDSVANAIGGAALAPARILLDLYEEMGGTPEATILATGRKAPVLHAAYVNSALANLLDFDDTYSSSAHPGATAIPPALAVAEKLGASGKDLVNAVVVGYEVMLRVGIAIKASPARYKQVTGFSNWQTVGATAVAAKLYGLDAEGVAHAFSLGVMNAPVPNIRKLGLEVEERPFAWTKNNYGWASMGGVLGATLAARGFKGSRAIFDGERGFWVMAGSDRCDFAALTTGLGETYLMPQTGLKPYACCRWTHTSLDALRSLIAGHAVRPDEVERIEVRSFFELYNNFGGNYRPQNTIDLQFNLPYLLAMELAGRSPRLGLAEDLLADPTIVALANRVVILSDPEADRLLLDTGEMLTTVTVILKDGRRLTAREDTPTGDPGRELSDDDLRAKFRALAEPIVGPARTEQAIEAIGRLEKLESVRSLWR